MLYLIDTDILIYSFKNEASVIEHFKRKKEDPKYVSVISYGELLYGAHRSQHYQKNLANVHRLAEIYPVIDIDRSVMESFALIKSDLHSQGTPLDDMDLLIAATALSHNLTLVTNNEKHFTRVPGLSIENWR